MSSLAVFRRIVFAAVLAGLIAGLTLTAVQQWRVVPLILEAETYERQATGNAGDTQGADAALARRDAPPHAHDHPHGSAHAVEDHSHAATESHHEDGAERTFFTALVNISLAVGFGLLLVAAYSLLEKAPDWRSGLLWGAAGYAVFFVAPSLGLPPELPGAEAAPLAARKIWWILTVLSSMAGLALIAFSPRMALKLCGAVLLVVPHLFGAPHPPLAGGTAPVALAETFVAATAVANAAFWLVLGALTAFFYRRAA